MRKLTSDRFLSAVTVCYIILLITSNVMASKVLAAGTALFDAGTLTYPLSFMLGDILAEVYGYRTSQRVILWGFAANAGFSLAAWAGTLLPAADAADGLAAAYDALFGYNPRILAASFAGYIAGALLNAASLVWLKRLTGDKWLAFRTIGSTALGAAVDTALFTLIAWARIRPQRELAVMAASGYALKMLYEGLIATPLDYLCIPALKRLKATAFPEGTRH